MDFAARDGGGNLVRGEGLWVGGLGVRGSAGVGEWLTCSGFLRCFGGSCVGGWVEGSARVSSLP